MLPAIECKLSCSLCGLKGLTVFVPERQEGQDVAVWMEQVCIPHMAEAHAMNSPHCKPKTLSEVMIPMSTKGVGFQPTGYEEPIPDGPL